MTGRHRVARRPRTAVWCGAVAATVVAVVLAVTAAVHRSTSGDESMAADQRTTHPAPAGSLASAVPGITTASVDPRTTSAGEPSTAGSRRKAVVTPQGMWWGVDSTEPISRATLRNVASWYRGARPQFWGRYLLGDYGVTAAELAFARSRHVSVYLIVADRNCSGCAGGDVCGNDRTTAQARSDAEKALHRAKALDLPTGVVLFKDIEEVSSCRGEPTAEYLLAWHRTLRETHVRTGFYGNAYKPYYEFPVAYCAAVDADRRFAREVVLDMNQPEPRLGAPQGTTGPRNAPRFAPRSPPCAPKARTVLWQYGESIDPANVTDVDQARADTHGMLAPDGGVT
ncbi:protein of unknown function [Jatrophihabitans endophyticus]|uniref:Rv2525c-like glycoside hydrolase-like domain-containing protein n=1 Tax=Jatrophihabitans endophyticus TaxID=1206085 RepID=A0A1M5S402_9ACTN|nr:glycoside hydrolase domain-containing protein [Jatrophihabitans endophyticus]SHH33175.1 protein of unknown function [Jatrophihabitans endophyticus]